MADKYKSEAEKGKTSNADKRFNYVGFDVHPGKIKDLFRSDAEKDKWVKKVLEKREKGSGMRENNSFDEPRIAGYEKIVMGITSLLLIATLFMPWFSGYAQFEVVSEPTAKQEIIADSTMLDSAMIAQSGDSGIVMGGSEDGTTTPGESATASASEAIDANTGDTATGSAGEIAEEAVAPPEKDEMGFASLTWQRKHIEIRREYYSTSAIGALGMLGDVFSSGIILKLTGALILFYMLLCLASAGYTLYIFFMVKGDADVIALKLKKALKLNWIPIGIWVFCMMISLGGASYSFESGAGSLVQLGDSYGIGVFLGLLSYGFYVSLACFVMNAVKAVEI